MDQVRISAKKLGQLALPTFCPRCFWLKMRLKNQLPWSIFPGIFSSIDSYSKKVTNLFWERNDRLPGWFRNFGDLVRPVPTPHHNRFFIIDEETGIRLTGVPDEILRQRDGFFFIADYKTARFTAHQDELIPMYEVQLNGYAYIGNRQGFDPVAGIGLVYYEPRTELAEERLSDVILADGFYMRFEAKIMPLELRAEEMIPPLLRKAREIVDCDEPPLGRQGCKDCQLIDKLIGLLRQ